MNPVSIVTIKNKIPLYKGDEQANSIEVIELEEVGFELVANKTLYNLRMTRTNKRTLSSNIKAGKEYLIVK